MRGLAEKPVGQDVEWKLKRVKRKYSASLMGARQAQPPKFRENLMILPNDDFVCTENRLVSVHRFYQNSPPIFFLSNAAAKYFSEKILNFKRINTDKKMNKINI